MKDKRSKEATSVGNIIKNMLEEYSLEKKYDQTELISSWRKIVGDPIANRTIRMFIKSDVLYVELSSSALKHELNMSRDRILERITEDLGSSIVSDLRFL